MEFDGRELVGLGSIHIEAEHCIEEEDTVVDSGRVAEEGTVAAVDCRMSIREDQPFWRFLQVLMKMKMKMEMDAFDGSRRSEEHDVGTSRTESGGAGAKMFRIFLGIS